MRRCRGKASGGVGDDDAGALGNCLRHETVAIRRASAKGNKERAFADSPRVILDARDFRIGSGSLYAVDAAQDTVEMQRTAHASRLLLRLTKRSAVSLAETDATLVSMNP